MQTEIQSRIMLLVLTLPLVAVAWLGMAAQSSSPANESVVPTVVLCVSVPVNGGLDIHPELERDQLIRNLTAASRDKKPAALQLVPLNGSDVKKLAEQARDSKCGFVLFTSVSAQAPLNTPSRNRAGVQSPVASGEGSGGGKLNVQYSLTKLGEAKPVAGGAILTPDNLDGNDIDRALQGALQDLARMVIKDIQKQSVRQH